MSDQNRAGDLPGSLTPAPGGDLAGTPMGNAGGVTYVDNEPAFEKPKGRTASAVVLGMSQSIDNSEGGVSKTFSAQLLNAFAVNDTALGLMNAMSMVARMAFGPLWAILADRFGRKAILFVVTGMWGFFTIGAAFAPDWNSFLIIYFISLIGTVASEPILNGLLGSLYDKTERGKAFGLVRGVSAALGFIITPVLGQFGNDPNGWRIAYIAMGVLSVISGFLILLLVKEPKKVAKEDSDDLKAEAGVFKWSDAAKLMKIPTIALMVPMLFMVTSLVLFAFVGTLWARDFGYGTKNGAYLYTVMQVGMMLSAFLGGWLGDFFVRRFGQRGRIMLFQVYAVCFGAITFVLTQMAGVFDPDIARGDGRLATNDPSIAYYVIAFLAGLVFSWGFSGAVLPMISSVAPTQLSATAFAVLFSLVQGAINVVIQYATGLVSASLGNNLVVTLLWFVSVPYFLNAIYWFVFYKFFPKDVERQAERTQLVAEGRF